MMQLKRLCCVIFMLGIGLGFSLGSPLITHNQDYSIPVTKRIISHKNLTILSKSTECGPCGWIHYRDGNRNEFTASDVTENIL